MIVQATSEISKVGAAAAAAAKAIEAVSRSSHLEDPELIQRFARQTAETLHRSGQFIRKPRKGQGGSGGGSDDDEEDGDDQGPAEEERPLYDYSKDNRTGYDQFAPFFRHGKDSLDMKKMRMMTLGQVIEDMGKSVFQTLGDALRNFVVNKVFPDASPGDVFRHVFAVHVVEDLPRSQINEVVGEKIKFVTSKEFLNRVLKDDLSGQVRVSTSISEGKSVGEFHIVVVQVLEDTLDVWRTDNPHTPAHPGLMQSLLKRVKKLRRQGRLDGFECTKPERKPTKQEQLAEQLMDEEFSRLSFEEMLAQTKVEMAERAAEAAAAAKKPAQTKVEVAEQKRAAEAAAAAKKPVMSPEERERKRAEIAARVAQARRSQAAQLASAGDRAAGTA